MSKGSRVGPLASRTSNTAWKIHAHRWFRPRYGLKRCQYRGFPRVKLYICHLFYCRKCTQPTSTAHCSVVRETMLEHHVRFCSGLSSTCVIWNLWPFAHDEWCVPSVNRDPGKSLVSMFGGVSDDTTDYKTWHSLFEQMIPALVLSWQTVSSSSFAANANNKHLRHSAVLVVKQGLNTTSVFVLVSHPPM